ncbi:MAG: folate-binding protein YgfZ [Proteobacteria bacterium]|nr:folate-binding protein YgfZ [Pseudomonadota bacterium]
MSWQDILGTHWTLTEHGEAVGPENNLQGGTSAIPLPGLSQIEVSGEDATDFLQGQFSNDIKALDDHHWQLSAYCNPKGRILALMRITKQEHNYRLILPTEIAKGTLKRLQMFVMRSRVTLRLCDDELLMGLAGDDLNTLVPYLSTVEHGAGHSKGMSALTMPGASLRLLVTGNSEQISKLWSECEANATGTGSGTNSMVWRQMDIESGIPQVFEASKEMFVPQMLNVDILDGVNFKKGCYPGQEIVARMHYLGKLKKRMYLGTFKTNGSCPLPGEAVYSDSFGTQAAGNIVDAAIDANGNCSALMSVQISSADKSDLHAESSDGPEIILIDLPYSFPDDPDK